MKLVDKVFAIACMVACALVFAGCSSSPSSTSASGSGSSESTTGAPTDDPDAGQQKEGETQDVGETAADQEEDQNMSEVSITVNGSTVTATLEDNSSARAFAELLQQGDLTLTLEDYGGFEKTGPLGQALPTEDERFTMVPGDLILYQGDQMSLPYGENAWSYTRLGHIDGATADSMRELLGDGVVEVTFSAGA